MWCVRMTEDLGEFVCSVCLMCVCVCFFMVSGFAPVVLIACRGRLHCRI